jgi:hypothetical protein
VRGCAVEYLLDDVSILLKHCLALKRVSFCFISGIFLGVKQIHM